LDEFRELIYKLVKWRNGLAFCLEWNLGGIPVKVCDGTVSRSPCSALTSVTQWEDLAAHLDYSEGARYVRGMELMLSDTLRATLPRTRYGGQDTITTDPMVTLLVRYDRPTTVVTVSL
ncbi:hypothetical protein HAX54_027577, partial [Datura stramonium]|nr:hypothetical protein [Datura stramonium]